MSCAAVWKNFVKLYGDTAEGELTLDMVSKDAVLADLSYENWTAVILSACVASMKTLVLSGCFEGQIPFERLTGLAVYLPSWIKQEL